MCANLGGKGLQPCARYGDARTSFGRSPLNSGTPRADGRKKVSVQVVRTRSLPQGRRLWLLTHRSDAAKRQTESNPGQLIAHEYSSPLESYGLVAYFFLCLCCRFTSWCLRSSLRKEAA